MPAESPVAAAEMRAGVAGRRCGDAGRMLPFTAPLPSPSPSKPSLSYRESKRPLLRVNASRVETRHFTFSLSSDAICVLSMHQLLEGVFLLLQCPQGTHFGFVYTNANPVGVSLTRPHLRLPRGPSSQQRPSKTKQ